jgi:hypothetical protein
VVSSRIEVEKAFDGFIERINKHRLRFALGNGNGKYSGTWVAWGHGCNFYIGARSILGSMKISLHESGICRVALTEQRMKLLAVQGLQCPSDRAFIKWRRAPTPETGAALAVSLTFPTRYFRLPSPVGTPKTPTLILDTKPEWEAAEIGFFYTREPSSSLGSKLKQVGIPMFHVELEDGEAVSIVVRRGTFDPAVLPTPEMLNRAAMRKFTRDLEAAIDKPILTAALWSDPKDGEALHVTEIGGVTLKRA